MINSTKTTTPIDDRTVDFHIMRVQIHRKFEECSNHCLKMKNLFAGEFYNTISCLLLKGLDLTELSLLYEHIPDYHKNASSPLKRHLYVDLYEYNEKIKKFFASPEFKFFAEKKSPTMLKMKGYTKNIIKILEKSEIKPVARNFFTHGPKTCDEIEMYLTEMVNVDICRVVDLVIDEHDRLIELVPMFIQEICENCKYSKEKTNGSY